MAEIDKKTPASSLTVRNADTGEYVTVRGVGAPKGLLSLKKGVDLTKPIASQALKGSKSSRTPKR
jgi:hypothetical protein